MLLAGDIQTLNRLPVAGLEVINFSSLNIKYPRLKLFPPYEFGARSDYEFDMKYAQFLMSDSDAFIDFISIPYNLYLGKSVYILIDRSDEFEMINESLFKFLQQRYGLNVAILNDPEEVMMVGDTFFSQLGIINFQHDKERLSQNLERARIAAGGAPGGTYEF